MYALRIFKFLFRYSHMRMILHWDSKLEFVNALRNAEARREKRARSASLPPQSVPVGELAGIAGTLLDRMEAPEPPVPAGQLAAIAGSLLDMVAAPVAMPPVAEEMPADLGLLSRLADGGDTGLRAQTHKVCNKQCHSYKHADSSITVYTS